MFKNIVLVDGFSCLFRVFYALPRLINSKGMHIGAILGFIKTLHKLTSKFKTHYFVVIFDAKGKNFRHLLYSKYKANRKKVPYELRMQIEPLQRIIQYLGYLVVTFPMVEADDVIGSMASNFSLLGHKVFIVTNDKDMFQLISNSILVFNFVKNEIFDSSKVVKKFGILPSQFADYLALVGDTADNIPGVLSVGPKTAIRWLGAYRNLKGIVHNASYLSGVAGKHFRNSLDHLFLSYQLAKINTNLKTFLPLSSIIRNTVSLGSLQKILKYYELTMLLSKL
jgi:DNA polymerase-1